MIECNKVIKCRSFYIFKSFRFIVLSPHKCLQMTIDSNLNKYYGIFVVFNNLCYLMECCSILFNPNYLLSSC